MKKVTKDACTICGMHLFRLQKAIDLLQGINILSNLQNLLEIQGKTSTNAKDVL